MLHPAEPNPPPGDRCHEPVEVVRSGLRDDSDCLRPGPRRGLRPDRDRRERRAGRGERPRRRRRGQDGEVDLRQGAPAAARACGRAARSPRRARRRAAAGPLRHPRTARARPASAAPRAAPPASTRAARAGRPARRARPPSPGRSQRAAAGSPGSAPELAPRRCARDDDPVVARDIDRLVAERLRTASSSCRRRPRARAPRAWRAAAPHGPPPGSTQRLLTAWRPRARRRPRAGRRRSAADPAAVLAGDERRQREPSWWPRPARGSRAPTTDARPLARRRRGDVSPGRPRRHELLLAGRAPAAPAHPDLPRAASARARSGVRSRRRGQAGRARPRPGRSRPDRARLASATECRRCPAAARQTARARGRAAGRAAAPRPSRRASRDRPPAPHSASRGSSRGRYAPIARRSAVTEVMSFAE